MSLSYPLCVSCIDLTFLLTEGKSLLTLSAGKRLYAYLVDEPVRESVINVVRKNGHVLTENDGIERQRKRLAILTSSTILLHLVELKTVWLEWNTSSE